MKTRNKLIALMLIFATMFLCVGVTANQVDAATSRKLLYQVNTLSSMRTKDSSSSIYLGSLKKYARVVIVSTNCKNGYVKVYPVQYNSKRKVYERYGQFAVSCANQPVYIKRANISAFETRTVDMSVVVNDIEDLNYYTK